MSVTASTDRARGAGAPGALFAALLVVAVVAYPLALKWCMGAGHPELGAMLAGIVCVALLGAIGARRTAAAVAIGLASLAVIAALAGVANDTLGAIGRITIFAPSVLIMLTLATLFGRTLRRHQTPLLTRLARQARGSLPPRAVAYTRALTWFWTLLLLGLGVTSGLLGVWASFETWSLFANGLNYAIAAGAFVGEYLFRRWWLSDMRHPGFFEYLNYLRHSRRAVAQSSDAS